MLFSVYLDSMHKVLPASIDYLVFVLSAHDFVPFVIKVLWVAAPTADEIAEVEDSIVREMRYEAKSDT